MFQQLKYLTKRYRFLVVGFGAVAVLILTAVGVIRTAPSDQPGEQPVEERSPVAEEVIPPTRSNQPAAMGAAEESPAEESPADTPSIDLNQMQAPVDGVVSFDYGWVFSTVINSWMFHPGIDLAAEDGEPVKAAFAGTVSNRLKHDDYGQAIVIEHGPRWTTLYGQLESVQVKEGQIVEAGTVIARVGSPSLEEAGTGPHLHFELRDQGEAINSASYLP